MFANRFTLALISAENYFAQVLPGAIALCVILSPAWADTQPASFAVQVSGFAHARGHVVANLFRAEDDVLKPEKSYQRISAEISDGVASMVFANLAYGNYAVLVFHDENDNGTLDHNFMRLPAEPLGFSNDFKLSVFSGMPSFEKLKISFTADTLPLKISVK